MPGHPFSVGDKEPQTKSNTESILWPLSLFFVLAISIACMGLNIHLADKLNKLQDHLASQTLAPTLTYATQSQISSVLTSSLSAPLQLTLIDENGTRHFLSMTLRRNSGSGVLDFELKKNAYCSSDLSSLKLASMQLYICGVYIQSSMTSSQAPYWTAGTSIGTMESPCVLEDPTDDAQKEQYSHCIAHELSFN
jgi:hypothetical protein